MFVGIDKRTGQYMVHSGDGVKLSRTVVRVPEANKWDKELLSGVRATPWDLHRPRDPEVVLKDKADAVTESFEHKVAMAATVHPS